MSGVERHARTLCPAWRLSKRYGAAMAATAMKIPYADASPAELREAILPEDRDQFDESYRRVLAVMGQTLSLEPLEEFLEHWRRIARSANHHGHDHWRGVLAEAERRLAGGAPPEEMASEREMDELIAARLGR